MAYAPPFKADMSGFYNNLPRNRLKREREEKLHDKQVAVLDKRLRSMDQEFDLNQDQFDLQRDRFEEQKKIWANQAAYQELQTSQLRGQLKAANVRNAAKAAVSIYDPEWAAKVNAIIRAAGVEDPEAAWGLEQGHTEWMTGEDQRRQTRLADQLRTVEGQMESMDKLTEIEGHPGTRNLLNQGELNTLRKQRNELNSLIRPEGGDFELRTLQPDSKLVRASAKYGVSQELDRGYASEGEGGTSLKDSYEGRIGNIPYTLERDRYGNWIGFDTPAGTYQKEITDVNDQYYGQTIEVPATQTWPDFHENLGRGSRAEAEMELHKRLQGFMSDEPRTAPSAQQDAEVSAVTRDLSVAMGTPQGTPQDLGQKIVSGEGLDEVQRYIYGSALTPNANDEYNVRRPVNEIIYGKSSYEGDNDFLNLMSALKSKPLWVDTAKLDDHPIMKIAKENAQTLGDVGKSEINLTAAALLKIDPDGYAQNETLGSGLLQNLRHIGSEAASARISTDYLKRFLGPQGPVLTRLVDDFKSWVAGRNPVRQRIWAASTIISPLNILHNRAVDRTILGNHNILVKKADNIDKSGKLGRFMPAAASMVMANEQLLKNGGVHVNMDPEEMGEALAEAETDPEYRDAAFKVINGLAAVTHSELDNIWASRHLRDGKKMKTQYQNYVLRRILGPKWETVAGFSLNKKSGKQGVQISELRFKNKANNYERKITVYENVDGNGGLLLQSYAMPALSRGFYVHKDSEHEYNMLLDGLFPGGDDGPWVKVKKKS